MPEVFINSLLFFLKSQSKKDIYYYSIYKWLSQFLLRSCTNAYVYDKHKIAPYSVSIKRLLEVAN